MQYVYLLAFTPAGAWVCANAAVEINPKAINNSLNIMIDPFKRLSVDSEINILNYQVVSPKLI